MTSLFMGEAFPKSLNGPSSSGVKDKPSLSQTVDGKGQINPLMGEAFPKSLIDLLEERMNQMQAKIEQSQNIMAQALREDIQKVVSETGSRK